MCIVHLPYSCPVVISHVEVCEIDAHARTHTHTHRLILIPLRLVKVTCTLIAENLATLCD